MGHSLHPNHHAADRQFWQTSSSSSVIGMATLLAVWISTCDFRFSLDHLVAMIQAQKTEQF